MLLGNVSQMLTIQDIEQAWSILDQIRNEENSKKRKREDHDNDYDDYDQPTYSEVESVYHLPGCESKHNEGFVADMLTGDYVCMGCGAVSHIRIIDGAPDLFLHAFRPNTYRRIHHWNERIGQFLCNESPTPSHIMMEIRLWFREHKVPVNKTRIREALNHIKEPKFVEKWISIQCTLTQTAPPNPEQWIIDKLRFFFVHVEIAFMRHKPSSRKSMINYNFLFVRVLQYISCPEYYRYFPMLKSKNKVRALDAVWREMTEDMGWTYMPLPSNKEFR